MKSRENSRITRRVSFNDAVAGAEEPSNSHENGTTDILNRSETTDLRDVESGSLHTASNMGDSANTGRPLRSSKPLFFPLVETDDDEKDGTNIISNQPEIVATVPNAQNKERIIYRTANHLCTFLLQFFCNVDRINVKPGEFITPLLETLDSIISYEFFIPYLPPFKRPGWLLYCLEALRDPKTRESMLSTMFADACAGTFP